MRRSLLFGLFRRIGNKEGCLVWAPLFIYFLTDYVLLNSVYRYIFKVLKDIY